MPDHRNYILSYYNGNLLIGSEPKEEKHDDGSTTYTSEDEIEVSDDFILVYVSVKTEDEDGVIVYMETTASMIIKDIDEHGNEMVTTTSAISTTYTNGTGEEISIKTDEVKVRSVSKDVEGKDVISVTSSSRSTEIGYLGELVTEQSKVEEEAMVTEASYIVGREEEAAIRTTVLKDGDTVSLTDVSNAERQMATAMELLEDVTFSDRSMSVKLSGTEKTVDNDAFARMGDIGMTFSAVSDSGSLTYSPEVARTFGGYDEPIVVSLESDTYDDMNERQKEAVPKDSFVVSVTATSGQTHISDLGGEFTMSFPFDIPEGWKLFRAFYLDTEGILHEERYGFTDGWMTVTMNHHSDVVILQLFSIELSQEGEGTVSVDKETVREGETVTLTAEPAEGYRFSGWETYPAVTITDNTFIMPADDVDVKAVFIKDQPVPGPTLVKIAVVDKPAKTGYTEGEHFDPSGLSIKAEYDDGTSVTVVYSEHKDEFSFMPPLTRELKVSDTTMTIEYGGMECTVDITVSAKDAPAPSGDNTVLYVCLIAIAILLIAVAAIFIIKRGSKEVMEK